MRLASPTPVPIYFVTVTSANTERFYSFLRIKKVYWTANSKSFAIISAEK
jgi:hypothetical protein